MISRETILRGFPMKPLGEVAEFLDSRRRPITASERIPGPYPYYGANGQQDSVADYIFDEPLILLAEDGGPFDQPDRGIAYAIEGKTWVNNHAHVLRPRDHARLRYLVRVLENYDVTPWITGSTRAKLTKAGAFKIQIPLPPLAEQKRIAGILDAADALRAKRREALVQLDSLLQSTFLDMFGDPVTNPMGWERKPLGEVIRVRSGDGLVSKDMVPDGRYPVYGGNGISGYHDSFMFEEPRIVLGRVGVYCGAVHLTRPRAWVTDNALYVHTFIQPVDTIYVVTALKMANLNQYAGRSAQPLISGNRIYPVEILIPPLDLQHRFAAIVASVEQQRARQRAHLAELDTLFASVQSRAFRGDL